MAVSPGRLRLAGHQPCHVPFMPNQHVIWKTPCASPLDRALEIGGFRGSAYPRPVPTHVSGCCGSTRQTGG
eukprot:2601034-Lingulodinium_polyedra.AAC.1